MKKSILSIAILLSLFCVGLSSCEKDSDESPLNTDASATYKLIMDGNIVAEGTSTNKVLMSNNTINLGGTGSDLVITITEVPESIGGVADIASFSISGINLLESGDEETYWGFSGTVTRTSATKISFDGACGVKPSAVQHPFSGYVESDAYKVK